MTNTEKKLPKTKRPQKISSRIGILEEKLNTFLDNNKTASIVETKLKKENRIRLQNPWDDSSFSLRIPENADNLIAALNHVKLPTRLSAIWHTDTRDLEIIWTAHNLPPSQQEVLGRTFSFNFDERSHSCEFGSSSERLLEISKHVAPITMSNTNYRNLQSFSQYSRIPKNRHADFGLSQPISFWIRDVDGDEDAIIRIVDNLNFYLTYFDSRSPNILIHDPAGADDQVAQRTRYLHGDFPIDITGNALDPHMLSFWSSAYTENPMMAFLLYFRVMEYAAIHYVDSAVRTQLRKILKAPNFTGKLELAIEQIVGSLHIQKMDDTQKFKAVVRQCVDPKLLWKDVQPNLAFFSKDTEFDGGFTVKKLVSADEKEQTFCTRGVESFSDSARKIRNALSHGKDMETSGVITPTGRNLKLLLPWVHLMATAAGEVVLYNDTA